VNRQGERGTVISVGEQLRDYGLDPKEDEAFVMIEYDTLGLVCEPAEDIDLERADDLNK
jgi:hypothetical protein